MSNYTPGVRCITLLLTPNIVLDTVPWKPVKPLLVKISLHAPNVNFPKVFFFVFIWQTSNPSWTMFSIKAQNARLRKFSVTGVAQLSFQTFGQWEAARKTAKEKIGERFAPHSSPVFSFWNRLGGKLLFILQEDLAPQAAQANIMNASYVRLQLTEYCLE